MAQDKDVVLENQVVCHILTLEGDRFVLTLPTKEQLHKISDTSSIYYEAGSSSPEGTYMLYYTEKKEQPIGYALDDWFIPPEPTPPEKYDPHEIFFWRPCLIPLNRYNQRDKEFFQQNPVGTVMTGCVFTINGYGHGRNKNRPTSPVYLEKTEHKVQISDFPENGYVYGSEPLEWVCLSDCIIAKEPVAAGPIEVLYECGLLPILMEHRRATLLD